MEEIEQTYSVEGDDGVEVKSKKGWLYLTLLLVILLVAGVVYMSNSYTEPIKFSKITITGNSIINQNDIIRNINLSKIDTKDKSYFLSELKKQIEKNPYVGFSYVYQKNSSEVVVEIHEKVPAAILIDDSFNNYFVSSDGSVLPVKVLHFKSDFPIIRGINATVNNSSKILKSALEIVSYLDCNNYHELSRGISEIVYNPIDKNFKIILSESGKEIMIGNSSEIENKSIKLIVLLNSIAPGGDLADAEYIDLRWNNQIVVKNKSAVLMQTDSLKKNI